jgi:hypothetical protein
VTGNITVDTSALDRLARKLIYDAPAKVQRALRKSVLQAGNLVAGDAAGRTTPKIAGTIKVGARAATAKITAGNDEVPEAALLEGDGTQGQFRHPLFGNKRHWYEQERKPYLHPALDARKQNAQDLIVSAAADAVRQSLET